VASTFFLSLSAYTLLTLFESVCTCVCVYVCELFLLACKQSNHNHNQIMVATLTQMGRFAALLGKRSDALQYLTEAIDMDPSKTVSRIYRGAILSRDMHSQDTESAAKAMEDLDAAISIDPTRTEAYIIRGDIFRAQGKEKERFTHFTLYGWSTYIHIYIYTHTYMYIYIFFVLFIEI
jgi:Tfp pilus assembly protein PilF